MTELIASGPLRYLGGSIETFALPMGTFIVIALIVIVAARDVADAPRQCRDGDTAAGLFPPAY